MATTSTTDPMHPAHTGGRREYLAAWSAGRAAHVASYAIVAVLGIAPLDATTQGAVVVLAGTVLVALVAQSRLHSRAWQWIPGSAPASPTPAPFFWVASAGGVIVPLACAAVVGTFTQTAHGPLLTAVLLAADAGTAYAAAWRRSPRRDRYAALARGAAGIAASVMLSPSNAPTLVAICLVATLLIFAITKPS
ncbi:hypothetical protein RI685_16380 (plasmid) [Clavibacter michiganensis]|uniref:hypothetical protein n=1 Tax=Clavibacter michiganensis TaxID=28447 RepID=UPI003DA15CC6